MSAMRRHSWWVWVLVVIVGWAVIVLAPKIHKYTWVPERPAIYSPR